MTDQRFYVDLCIGPSATHLVCSGDLDLGAARCLRAAVISAVHAPPRTLIVNAYAATAVTADFVGAITDAASLCREQRMNFEVILNAETWRTVDLLGARGLLLPPGSECDYAIPPEVADALHDVMGEREIYEAFFRESSPLSV